MTVYLIHFARPLAHAQHYVGFTTDESTLEARLDHHRKGNGARLMAAVTFAGIPWDVVRVWPEGTRDFERSLKSHSGTRYCPTCRGPEALRRKPT